MHNTITQKDIEDYLEQFQNDPQFVHTASQFAAFLIHKMEVIDTSLNSIQPCEEKEIEDNFDGTFRNPDDLPYCNEY